ncbi:divergent polysaccharide deacetylase family protein [Hyphococcus sp.]|uniref:divergent polysaccharide deacetylase family protein n=1 Tax=Hyphococcus sp. TaxID=2038636 RepID=UPI0035C6E5FB
MPRRRRIKAPVLSRLTWAWLGSLVLFAGAVGVFVYSARTGEGPGRIALPVDHIEIFARNTPPAPGTEERIEAPVLREPPAGAQQLAQAPSGEETEDGLVLIYPGANDLRTDEEDGLLYDESDLEPEDDGVRYSADDVIITIPGARKATSVTAASLTPVARPIPDPDSALLRVTALGKTPRVAADGRRPVSYYAKPFDGARSKPRVAIVVGGLGLNAAVTERAIDDLPPEISLSFAPYAKNLDFWTKKARDAGHEVLIELPMESYGANAQALGAAALLTSREPQENLQRLDWLLARFGGYFAATNYMGAKFSADADALAPILERLKNSGVGYVDDTGAAARSAGGLPLATVTRMIPAAIDDADLRQVQRELAALESAAERDGFALGKTYAYAATIDEIASWSRGLEKKGIAQAPASALLRTAAPGR